MNTDVTKQRLVQKTGKQTCRPAFRSIPRRLHQFRPSLICVHLCSSVVKMRFLASYPLPHLVMLLKYFSMMSPYSSKNDSEVTASDLRFKGVSPLTTSGLSNFRSSPSLFDPGLPSRPGLGGAFRASPFSILFSLPSTSRPGAAMMANPDRSEEYMSEL